MIFIEDSRIGLLDIIDEWLPEKYNETTYEEEEFKNYKLVRLFIENADKSESTYTCPHCQRELNKDELLEYNADSQILLIFSKEKSNPIFLLVTNAGSPEFDVDLNFFNALYPLISRVGFRSYTLKEILDQVSRASEVKAHTFVTKQYHRERSKSVEYPKNPISIETAYNKAKRNNLWIDSIECEVDEKKIRLSRKGKILFYQEFRFSEVFRKFIQPLMRQTLTRYKEVLTNNSRTEDNPEAKSLIYTTNEPAFQTKKDSEQFVELIKEVDEDLEVAILNSNSQMPEMTIKDYKSGSSYNVDVISEKDIVINPQTQVTEISLNKLISIFSNWHDGRIRRDE